QPIAELDFAPDRDSARTRTGDERRFRRYAGALDQQFHPFEQRLLLRSETKFDAEAAEPAGVDVGRSVGSDHLDPAAGERGRSRKTGACEPDHEGAPWQP